ncbi:hypothetical protein ACSBR2_031672 [Camellia fascicularis]
MAHKGSAYLFLFVILLRLSALFIRTSTKGKVRFPLCLILEHHLHRTQHHRRTSVDPRLTLPQKYHP